jgi:deoxyribonuclease-1
MEHVLLQHAEQLKQWEEKQQEVLFELTENQQKLKKNDELY